MRAFRSGEVPSWRNVRKSATYPRISLLVGDSSHLYSNWASASSRDKVSRVWRAFTRRRMLDAGPATLHRGGVVVYRIPGLPLPVV